MRRRAMLKHRTGLAKEMCFLLLYMLPDLGYLQRGDHRNPRMAARGHESQPAPLRWTMGGRGWDIRRLRDAGRRA